MKSKLLIFSLALALSAPAFAAGQWTSVTITHIQPFTSQYSSPGFIQVQFSANSTGSPSCASGFKAYAAVDVSTSSGAYAAAVLQSAFLSGTTVSVTGTGTCAIDSGVETLAYLTE